jgi:hypothetical protein
MTFTTRFLLVRVNVGIQAIEQHVLDTNAGKQLSYAATDV